MPSLESLLTASADLVPGLWRLLEKAVDDKIVLNPFRPKDVFQMT